MTVSEVEDPTGMLTAPVATTDDFAESLRWRAGPLLGGLDWLLEQLVGVSAIASLVRPLSGDWVGLSKAEQAWTQTQHASLAVGRNFEANAQPEGWTGEAAEAYGQRMTEIADTFSQYGEGCAAMAEVTNALVELAKTTAETIAGILKFLGDWLSRALVQMSVPVIGWAAGAVDGVISSARAIRHIERGLNLIQQLVNAVERFRSLIQLFQRLARTIRTVASTVSNVSRLSTVAAADGATSTAFGVEP